MGGLADRHDGAEGAGLDAVERPGVGLHRRLLVADEGAAVADAQEAVHLERTKTPYAAPTRARLTGDRELRPDTLARAVREVLELVRDVNHAGAELP